LLYRIKCPLISAERQKCDREKGKKANGAGLSGGDSTRQTWENNSLKVLDKLALAGKLSAK